MKVVSERLTATFRSGDIRWIEKPTAVPKAIGSRIDAAGLAKTAEGSVREGMYEVMLVTWSRFLSVTTQIFQSRYLDIRQLGSREDIYLAPQTKLDF